MAGGLCDNLAVRPSFLPFDSNRFLFLYCADLPPPRARPERADVRLPRHEHAHVRAPAHGDSPTRRARDARVRGGGANWEGAGVWGCW